MTPRLAIRLAALAAMCLPISLSAADIVIAPPAAGGVAITNAAGNATRLRVADDGTVALPGLTALPVAGTGLCIDIATGRIGSCAPGGGSSGTVTSIAAGTGLTGGTITTTGTIGIADGGVGTTQLANGSVTVAKMSANGCTNGQVLQFNGAAWSCATIATGAGTVTNLATGTGLTGGPITATGTISIANSGVGTAQLADGSVTTAKLAASGCSSGQILKFNGTAWACAADAGSAGTVTSVATGAGLTGGPITATGTIGLAATQLLPTTACTANQIPKWSGSAWTCAADATGSSSGIAQGGNAFGADAVLGTTDDFAVDFRANGLRVMRYEPDSTSPNVIGGSPANSVTAGVRGAVIGGGGVAGADPLFGGTGNPNRVTDIYGTVGGGAGNQAGDGVSTSASAAFATVGGGFANTASNNWSTVGGGSLNAASGPVSTVGGGSRNLASNQYSAVSGGSDNTASGPYGTVGGGNQSAASAFFSTVGGGNLNTADGSASTVGGGQQNNASVGFSTVGGGQLNSASGGSSTVVGGSSNRASGEYSTVGGGFANIASGAYSFAAGRSAKTQTAGVTPTVHDGTFVWADGSPFEFNSISGNEFAARATGGVRFITAIDGVGTPTATFSFGSSGVLGLPANAQVNRGASRFLHANGTRNAFLGTDAGSVVSSGFENAAVGHEALLANTTGAGNTAVGYRAMASMDGSFNSTAVGAQALLATTGAGNIALGAFAGANITTGANNIAIGNTGLAGDSGTMRLGAGQSRTFIAGVRGVTTDANNAIPVLIDGNGQLGTASSSRRFKDDIEDMDEASGGLMHLRPVTFHYKSDGDPAGKRLQYGLIAEEVAAVYPGLVARSPDGQVETVMYQFLPPMLLNEFQKQQRTIEAQARTIEAQAGRLAAVERELAAIRQALGRR